MFLPRCLAQRPAAAAETDNPLRDSELVASRRAAAAEERQGRSCVTFDAFASECEAVAGSEAAQVNNCSTLQGESVSRIEQETSEEPAEEPVKERCTQQRNAEANEPKCAVCGRFGEYICNETDDDVCSLECKSVLLASKASSVPSPYEDECPIFGVDGKPTLPEWEPDDALVELSAEQVAAVRRSMELSVRGDCPPPPVLDFASCRLPAKLLENLVSAGYESPTLIQMQALPAAFKGRDILVSSRTGSGKTLAFVLPIVFKCCRIRMGRFSEGRLPLAVVLAPTRELCEQVEEQAKALGRGLPFKTALVVGGDAMPQQVYRIRNGVELIVGTPGRLLDLLSKHEINLGDVCMLVLDEVDCMLERGFREQAMQIVQALSGPQTMLFSATIPPSIQGFSSSITKRLLLISAVQQSNTAVQQKVLWVDTAGKKKKLFEILQSKTHFQPPAVVFVGSRMGADLLSEAVTSFTGLRCSSLHGQKPMNERRQTMQAFLVGELDVIVATGIMGRGLDLLNVRQVILFDMPNTVQEYTHQIGRASRLSLPGSAFVFINNESRVLFRDFVRVLRASGVAVPQQLLKSPSLQQAPGSSTKRRKCKH